MSLDDTARELRAFKKELDRFNDTLRGAVKDLEKEHDRVKGIWNDSFRKDYDRRWSEFGSKMHSYLSKDANRYSGFVDQKIRQVEDYLRG